MHREAPLIVRVGRGEGRERKCCGGVGGQADGVMRIKHLEGAGDDRAKPR